MSSLRASRSPSDREGPTRNDTGSGVREASRRRKAVCFLAVGSALLIGSIDQTAMSTAVPQLSQTLDTDVGVALWSIIGYQLGQIVAMPTVGALSDQFGRRRVFLACLAVFTLASLAAASAPTIGVFIAFRLVQGMGAGGFIPAATGIVSDVFGSSRDRGIALFTSIFPIGNLVGPVIGGFVIFHWSWRWLLLVNVPIGLVCVVLTLAFIPADRPVGRSTFDVRGLILLTMCTSLSMAAITMAGRAASAVAILAALATAALAVAAAVTLARSSARLQHPILPVRLLRRGPLLSMNLVSFLYGGVIIGLSALVPLYAQTRYGLNPLEAGATLSGRAIGAITVTTATAILLRRIGTRLPMLVGFTLASCGVALLAVPPIVGGALLWLVLCTTVTGIGGGMGAPASMNAALRLAGPAIGSASGLRGLFRQIGGLVFVTIGSAVVAATAEDPVAFAGLLATFSSVLLLLVVPLVLSVPDERGQW